MEASSIITTHEIKSRISSPPISPTARFKTSPTKKSFIQDGSPRGLVTLIQIGIKDLLNFAAVNCSMLFVLQYRIRKAPTVPRFSPLQANCKSPAVRELRNFNFRFTIVRCFVVTSSRVSGSFECHEQASVVRGRSRRVEARE